MRFDPSIQYCANVMIANFVEFRRSSTKFYVNLRNFEENEFSAKFRWPYCFTINEISLGKFAEGGKIGSEISNEISNTLFV